MTPISPEIERKLNQLQSRIQQADALEQARRVDEAQAAYNACLRMAAHERIPLLGRQLVQIWMGIGFCYADRNDWHRALEWYHRAEAALLSAPVFNPNPKSPEAQANAKKWSPYLPEGVIVMFPQSYPAEAHLAELCDSIALGYDNDNQLERAKEYYQRSTDLHNRFGNPAREAEVWWHQAVGCQRREQWFDLEQAADKMRLAADRAQVKTAMLAARRLLAQSQINQNRAFKTMEYLGQAVLLGRELNDAKLTTDEGLLRDLIRGMRPDVLQRSQADFLEPLVYAETIVNDPNLAQDKALLQKWRNEQPATQTLEQQSLRSTRMQETNPRESKIWLKRPNQASVPTHPDKILEAEQVLVKFASKHGGPESVAKQWNVRVEVMDEFNPRGWERGASAAILDFGQMPQTMLGVILENPETLSAWMMIEFKLPGVPDAIPTWKPEFMVMLPSSAFQLEKLLDVLLNEGVLSQGPNGLQYTGKEPSFVK